MASDETSDAAAAGDDRVIDRDSTVYYTVGVLAFLILIVIAWARRRYRAYRRRVLARQARITRAEKLMDALAGTLRATANPDAAPATSLDPLTDTLVRRRAARRRSRRPRPSLAFG